MFSQRVRWRIVVVLCAVAFVLYIDRINITIAAPSMKAEYGFSRQSLGAILSAFLFGYAIGLVPGGWLADRFGPRRVLTVAGLAWVLITVLTGCVPAHGPDPRILLVPARFALGLCEACAYPTFNRAVANWMRHRLTLRWVVFTLEEPPWFRTLYMGSRIHARECRARGERIAGMISLEMVGYFCDEPRSQHYPLPLMRWFYPSQGNFVAVAGNFGSRRFVRRLSHALASTLPVESTALPFVPGVGLSDNWSFWQEGYPALMVTDTAFFRNPLTICPRISRRRSITHA